MPRFLALLLLLLAVACDGSQPVAPSTAPPTTPPSPPPVVLTGRVTASVTGDPLAGLSVDLGTRLTSTDGDGRFGYELPFGTSATFPLLLSGPGVVTRSTRVAVTGSRDLPLDAISLSSGFDLDFYRRFVRDTFDFPLVVRPLRRWTRAPSIYLKTVDEAGQPIESVTLEPVAAALADDVEAWTGGRFGLARVERGTETREGVSGWITVKWLSASAENICGRAQVAVDGGWIELNYLNRNCACQGSRITPGTVRHELGHAMGFYHTGDRADVMFGTITCNGRASARERFHAAIAYSRPFGNLDPDTDPSTSIQSLTAPVIVVD